MNEKIQLIYKLESISADDGVDVFEIAPILMSFGELIRSANEVLGYEKRIDVKVKPFREGSWITEFVLQNHSINGVLNFLHTHDGEEIMLLLAFLGLDVRSGISGVAYIIRFTKGLVTNFHKNDDQKTVTYTNSNGEELVVTLPEHKLVQSPLIQINYYNSIVSPLDKFPTATAVGIKVNQSGHTEQTFTQDDKSYFEKYAGTELLEDVDENISTMQSIYIKPKRGSYSGEEKAYSFIMGDSVLWPVTIEDEKFLEKLRNGEIRPYSEDVLKVNLEIRQKKDSKNKILAAYVITHVIEYIKYEKPKQLKIE
ncbi:hypothetical protein KBC70_00290 [Candidatus Woesebacteria bacterium]|nr:hypothetical protein [Candidatus Woesebacteria bacterium]